MIHLYYIIHIAKMQLKLNGIFGVFAFFIQKQLKYMLKTSIMQNQQVVVAIFLWLLNNLT